MLGFITGLPTKFIGGAALVLAAMLSIWYWHHSIIVANDAAWKAKIDKSNAEAQTLLQQKNAAVATHQSQLAAAQAVIVAKFQESQNAKDAYKKLQSDVNAGRVGLRIATTSYASSTTKDSSGTGTAAGVKNDTPQLVPEFSKNVLGFAREYSDNLRKLNECVQYYDAAKQSVNGGDGKP